MAEIDGRAQGDEFRYETGFAFIHGGGWVHYVQGATRAWIRFERDDRNRFVAVELQVAARGKQTLRGAVASLSLTKLEAFMNRAEPADHLELAWKSEHPDLSDLASWDVLNSPHLGGHLVQLTHQEVNALLDKPEGGRYGEAFYRDVAEAYNRLVQVTRSPATMLAETNDVPATTVHRWIRQARKLGFLPAGTPGKVG